MVSILNISNKVPLRGAQAWIKIIKRRKRTEYKNSIGSFEITEEANLL